ncbi:hypothetical protein BCR33DRAFT_713143, partial [Rhizoclosmatium globosum]
AQARYDALYDSVIKKAPDRNVLCSQEVVDAMTNYYESCSTIPPTNVPSNGDHLKTFLDLQKLCGSKKVAQLVPRQIANQPPTLTTSIPTLPSPTITLSIPTISPPTTTLSPLPCLANCTGVNIPISTYLIAAGVSAGFSFCFWCFCVGLGYGSQWLPWNRSRTVDDEPVRAVTRRQMVVSTRENEVEPLPVYTAELTGVVSTVDGTPAPEYVAESEGRGVVVGVGPGSEGESVPPPEYSTPPVR